MEAPTAYCVVLEKRTFRDVWWCFIVNEPMILLWRDDVPYCTQCMMDGDREALYRKAPDEEIFPDRHHAHICHIMKPTQSRIYMGDERGTH